jgi:hypothetical protein
MVTCVVKPAAPHSVWIAGFGFWRVPTESPMKFGTTQGVGVGVG